MVLYNRFRKSQEIRPSSTELKGRDLHDHITLAVGILGFVVLVVSIVVTQANQVATNKDTSAALQRFTSLADSSNAQVATLRDQAKAAVITAQAAQSQAEAARGQVAVLGKSLEIARQNANASNRLNQIAAQNLSSERYYRERALSAALPVLTASAEIVEETSSSPHDHPKLMLKSIITNKGGTAAFVNYYLATASLDPDDPSDTTPIGIPFNSTQPINRLIAVGDSWDPGQLPLDVPGLSGDFSSSGKTVWLSLFLLTSNYLNKWQIVCFGFGARIGERGPDVSNTPCPRAFATDIRKQPKLQAKPTTPQKEEPLPPIH